MPSSLHAGIIAFTFFLTFLQCNWSETWFSLSDDHFHFPCNEVWFGSRSDGWLSHFAILNLTFGPTNVSFIQILIITIVTIRKSSLPQGNFVLICCWWIISSVSSSLHKKCCNNIHATNKQSRIWWWARLANVRLFNSSSATTESNYFHIKECTQIPRYALHFCSFSTCGQIWGLFDAPTNLSSRLSGKNHQ